MPFNNFVHLSASEIVPHRPFTDPHRSDVDVTVLKHMCLRLTHALNVAELTREEACSWQVHIHEEDARGHRIIVTDSDALLAARELAVVGFCGQKRANIGLAVLHEMEVMDAELVDELTRQPHLLSYSSMACEDGNWVNLVLLRSAAGIQDWRASQRHADVAARLSPSYYSAIRLHNLTLTGGLSAPQMTLLRTKYYDFEGPCPWLAIREMALT